MLEAFKILLLLIYFVVMYLVSESFLVALVIVPIFTYIHLIKSDANVAARNIVLAVVAFILPALISLYFFFTPTHWNQEKPFSSVLLDAGLIGLFSTLIIGLYKACEYFQEKNKSEKPFLKIRTQQSLALISIPILLPLLIWGHVEYKIFQEKSFDKLAYTLLEALTTAQAQAYAAQNSYQKDLKAVGFTPGDSNDVYDIFLSSEALPFEYSQALPPSTLPFVAKKSYQALLVLKNPHSRTIKFFFCNDKKEIKQIRTQIPFKKTVL